ncbi:hypothetical protein D3C83_304090 [compost metagenome]
MTGVSMKSPMPENSIIVSALRAVSARDMPRMAPCRNRFSRPVRSGWKPAAMAIPRE